MPAKNYANDSKEIHPQWRPETRTVGWHWHSESARSVRVGRSGMHTLDERTSRIFIDNKHSQSRKYALKMHKSHFLESVINIGRQSQHASSSIIFVNWKFRHNEQTLKSSSASTWPFCWTWTLCVIHIPYRFSSRKRWSNSRSIVSKLFLLYAKRVRESRCKTFCEHV